MTVAEARKYLEVIQSIDTDRIGPLLRVGHSAPDLTQATELSTRLNRAILKVDETTYYAPSPWHAAAWLLDIAGLVAQVASEHRVTGLRSPIPPEQGAPVFRGHRDSAWTLVPALLREPRETSDALALEFFLEAQAELFRLVAEDTRMNGRFVHMAAAQHYGMHTPLLDFTADPRIAVWFASDSRGSAGSREAAVYGIPLNVAYELGGAVVLPPPWVKRLYAQRGVFIDCSGIPDGVDLRQSCFRILFPPEDAYRDWLFPKGADAILPPESWYECAIEWARKAAAAGDPARGSGRSGAALRAACGRPFFYFDSLSVTAMKRSLDGFVDLCEWLALKFFRGQLRYDLTAMEKLWAYNEPLFREHSAMWRQMNQLYGVRALSQDRTMAALEAVDATRPHTVDLNRARVPVDYEGAGQTVLPDRSEHELRSPIIDDSWLRQLQKEADKLLADGLAVSGLTYQEFLELSRGTQLGSDHDYEYEIFAYALQGGPSASLDPKRSSEARAAALFFDAGQKFSRLQEGNLPEFDRASACLHVALNFTRRVQSPEMRVLELRAVGALVYLHLTMADAIVEEESKPMHEEMAGRYAELQGFLSQRLGDRKGAAAAYGSARFRYARAGCRAESARAAEKEAEYIQ